MLQAANTSWEKSDSIIVERRELCGRRGDVWREGGKLEAEYWLDTIERMNIRDDGTDTVKLRVLGGWTENT